MTLGQWGYAALCVCVPMLWGLGVYAVSSRIEQAVLRRRPTDSAASGEENGLPLDYHI